jgi:hypothetical protein
MARRTSRPRDPVPQFVDVTEDDLTQDLKAVLRELGERVPKDFPLIFKIFFAV